jgi:hypothetical protein
VVVGRGGECSEWWVGVQDESTRTCGAVIMCHVLLLLLSYSSAGLAQLPGACQESKKAAKVHVVM